MENSSRESFWDRCGGSTPRDRANMRRVVITLLGWAVVFVGASKGIKGELVPPGPISWIVATLPVIAGILAVLAYRRFLNEGDELQRMVQLQALALGFGGSLFAMAGYQVFVPLGAPPADINDFIVVMSIFFSLGNILGWRRYR